MLDWGRVFDMERYPVPQIIRHELPPPRSRSKEEQAAERLAAKRVRPKKQPPVGAKAAVRDAAAFGAPPTVRAVPRAGAVTTAARKRADWLMRRQRDHSGEEYRI